MAYIDKIKQGSNTHYFDRQWITSNDITSYYEPLIVNNKSCFNYYYTNNKGYYSLINNNNSSFYDFTQLSREIQEITDESIAFEKLSEEYLKIYYDIDNDKVYILFTISKESDAYKSYALQLSDYTYSSNFPITVTNFPQNKIYSDIIFNSNDINIFYSPFINMYITTINLKDNNNNAHNYSLSESNKLTFYYDESSYVSSNSFFLKSILIGEQYLENFLKDNSKWISIEENNLKLFAFKSNIAYRLCSGGSLELSNLPELTNNQITTNDITLYPYSNYIKSECYSDIYIKIEISNWSSKNYDSAYQYLLDNITGSKIMTYYYNGVYNSETILPIFNTLPTDIEAFQENNYYYNNDTDNLYLYKNNQLVTANDSNYYIYFTQNEIDSIFNGGN